MTNIENKNIPAGTRDLIYEECIAPKEIEATLFSLYSKLGYQPVSTPVLEYYSTFNHGLQDIKEESIFKFSGMNGKTVALRPDNTSPILRVAMSKLKDEPLPLKLCYSQDVFRNITAFHAKRSQMLQSGIEIIGGDSVEEDIRCIFTALESLGACSNNYKLEIGHAGFIDALLDKFSLDSEEKDELRDFMSAKNSSEFPFASVLGNKEAVALAQNVQRLFGGIEIIEKAEKLAMGNEKAMAILNYIKYIVNVFIEAGYGDMIIIDLGIIQKIDYYTGLVFKGYVEGIGEAVLSGGRYDNLLLSFGSSLSACGFGLNISELALLHNSEAHASVNMSFSGGADDVIAAKAYLKG